MIPVSVQDKASRFGALDLGVGWRFSLQPVSKGRGVCHEVARAMHIECPRRAIPVRPRTSPWRSTDDPTCASDRR